MTDQQRFDSLGCYGCDFIETPNIDKLASEGVRYENCYVNNPVCTPSRASMLTGKHVNGHGVYQLHDILPEDQPLFTVKLKEKGYQTVLKGKLHVSGRTFERDARNPNDGFDVYSYAMTPHRTDGTYNSYGQWLQENRPEFHAKLTELGRNVGNIPPDCHFTYWAAEETIDMIENRSKERPFFCMMSVVDPHDPYSDYPLEALAGVHEERIPKPVFREGEPHDKPEAVQRAHDHGYLGGYHNYSPEDIHNMRLGYYASIVFLDEQVGRVLETLEHEGIKDNTLVIFISDHGDMLGDHEQFAKGPFFYDPSVKVPFIMRLPGTIPEGKVVDELVQPHDVGATVLSLAGFEYADIQKMMPGSLDLIAALKGTQPYRDYAVCVFRNTMISDEKVYFDPPIYATMMRTDTFKIVVYHGWDASCGSIEGELYHMKNDANEQHNLWNHSGYQDIRESLVHRVYNWLVASDMQYNGKRGGEMIPPQSQVSLNNPL